MSIQLSEHTGLQTFTYCLAMFCININTYKPYNINTNIHYFSMCRNGIRYFKELFYIRAGDSSNLYHCRSEISGIVPIENNAVASRSSIIKNLKVLEPDKFS